MDKIEMYFLGKVHNILEHDYDSYFYHPIGGDRDRVVYVVETAYNYNMGLDKSSTIMFQITLVCCSRLQICPLCANDKTVCCLC